MDRIAGLQDLQDRLFWLSWAQTIDRITGLQDCWIYRINCVGLNWGLKMDRITGLQDLQDRVSFG